MEAQVKRVLVECTEGSDQGRITFPQVVGKLIEVGIERYHADLVRAQKTYYTGDDAAETVPCHALDVTPAQAFSAADVDQAIRASQRGEITYEESCRRVARAGCVGYHVSIFGRRAVYYGRTGETHVEPFPSAQ